MTKDEIIAAIDAKIAGQGKQIDAGSVLPEILKGIVSLVETKASKAEGTTSRNLTGRPRMWRGILCGTMISCTSSRTSTRARGIRKPWSRCAW